MWLTEREEKNKNRAQGSGDTAGPHGHMLKLLTFKKWDRIDFFSSKVSGCSLGTREMNE